ncbi:hypothetical protein HHI36_014861 [Cryptolaemus montrouzieri]|uniref:Carboxylic ester hydrolase n=1 Tax=Cryptolaemus montrouzieri TaxID=559131 RepID=A0ABD2N536_9CUCU
MILREIIFYWLGFGQCFMNDEKKEDPIVSTPLGKYRGSILTSTLGKTIYSFRGIRYAKPPVKNLRFLPPVPVTKHTGIYNATEDGDVCPQLTCSLIPISEDCLFANVYTTKLPNENEILKRPVVIYIHSGALYALSGRSDDVGPQYFMDQDILLVTFNYRLGVLGFISTGDKEAPGNNGFKDQVTLMRWVKKNIEYFGGDPNSVTLFGYSAGGMSVTLHLISPMSKGLFHQAIIGSFSALGQWPTGRNQLDVTKRQARVVGCPDDTPANIIRCLRQRSFEELQYSLSKMFEFESSPSLLWKPVIEEDFGQERFLTDHPMKLVLEGKFHEVPILSGVTAEEFSYKAIEMVKNPRMLKYLDENWEKIAPIIFLYERDTQQSKMISRGLRSFYFGGKKLDSTILHPLAQLVQATTGFAVNRVVKLFSEKTNRSVYYYRFSYMGRYSYVYLPESNGSLLYGPVHQDDLIYIFPCSFLFPKFEKTDPEFRIIQKLTTMWANFARTGLV